MRKESGSLIASSQGIYAASRHLRHRDIAVTAAHYADKKTRVAIDTASLLKADEEPAGNIIEWPPWPLQQTRQKHNRRAFPR